MLYTIKPGGVSKIIESLIRITMSNSKKHLISLDSLTDEDFNYILGSGLSFANKSVPYPATLDGMVVGLYFRKTSTRTRTAFSSAAVRLGAKIISFGPNDLQENTGESPSDTVRVLSGMLDCLVARTASSHQEIELMASQRRMSVINAMTTEEHPTQALADLTTMKQVFGDIAGLRILYIGEGNNTASALCKALPRFSNTELFLYSPPGYTLPGSVIDEGRNSAKLRRSKIHEVSDLRKVPSEIDIVYTTRWQTTGTSKPDPNWRTDFEPFKVSPYLMDCHPKAIFMHDLPAHRGEEVDKLVLDGQRSIAFQQSDNKLHSAAAVFQWCLN